MIREKNRLSFHFLAVANQHVFFLSIIFSQIFSYLKCVSFSVKFISKNNIMCLRQITRMRLHTLDEAHSHFSVIFKGERSSSCFYLVSLDTSLPVILRFFFQIEIQKSSITVQNISISIQKISISIQKISITILKIS